MHDSLELLIITQLVNKLTDVMELEGSSPRSHKNAIDLILRQMWVRGQHDARGKEHGSDLKHPDTSTGNMNW